MSSLALLCQGSRDAQLTGEIVASAIRAPSQLNSGYNQSSGFTKFFGRKGSVHSVRVTWNLKMDTAQKTRSGNLDWDDNPDSKDGCNVSAIVQYTSHSLTRASWVTIHMWTVDVGRRCSAGASLLMCRQFVHWSQWERSWPPSSARALG